MRRRKPKRRNKQRSVLRLAQQSRSGRADRFDCGCLLCVQFENETSEKKERFESMVDRNRYDLPWSTLIQLKLLVFPIATPPWSLKGASLIRATVAKEEWLRWEEDDFTVDQVKFFVRFAMQGVRSRLESNVRAELEALPPSDDDEGDIRNAEDALWRRCRCHAHSRLPALLRPQIA